MLKRLIKSLSSLFAIKTRREIEEEWLAKSENLIELEWRQRQLMNRKGYYI